MTFSRVGASMVRHQQVAVSVGRFTVTMNFDNGNGLLFHMTQPISRSTIKAIAYSKPTVSEH